MDYDVINSAIEDIVCIVNRYNRTREYDIEVAEKLFLALFGYFISFGPEIFTKIDVVLEQLRLHKCNSDEECREKKLELRPDEVSPSSDPALTWDYCYDDNRKFIGAIPNIVYSDDDSIQVVFSMIHEISHALEGVEATILYETDEEMKLRHGFGEYLVNKGRTGCVSKNHGMTELITVTIENKIFRDLCQLDETKIVNQYVSEFLSKLKKRRCISNLIDSYGLMATAFKDLIDNDCFFELIKKYYYENQRELFIAEFNGLDERLSFQKLMLYADSIYQERISDLFYYMEPIRKQLQILNEATGFTPEQKLLIFV